MILASLQRSKINQREVGKMKKVVFLVVLMLLVGAGLFAEQIVIGYACRRLTNPYWVMTKNGVEDAAAKYGVKVILYDCQNDPAIQRNNVEDLIQAKVDAILITSIVTGSRASGAAADAAVRAGIPVIGVDTSCGSPRVAVTIRTDNVLGGRLAGKYIAEELNGKGKVIVLEGPAGDTNSALRVGGFKEVIAKYPNIKIVASQPADWSRVKGLNTMENLLQAFPDVDAVFGANDEMALGAIEALKAARKLKTTIVVGFDATPDALKSIKAGKMSATIQQHPYEEGYRAVELAIKILRDEPFESKVVMRPWPWGMEHAIEIPATLIDANNVDKYLK